MIKDKFYRLFGFNGKTEIHYSEEEIQQIREALSGKSDLRSKEIPKRSLPPYLKPFHQLAPIYPDLYRKISKDEKAKQFSLYGFFPEAFDVVYNDDLPAQLVFRNGSRGRVAILLHPSKKIVIKRIQNSREHEIVQLAYDLGVGPKQYPTIDGYLTEEFKDEPIFSSLDLRKEPSERIYLIGIRVGEILSLLHKNDIFYNDAILPDPLGNSHLVVPELSPAILIDYGVSIRLDNFPRLSDEEILNFFRTMPGGGIAIYLDAKEMDIFLQKSRQNMPSTKEQVMATDIFRLYEQLSSVKRRVGYPAADTIAKGFEASYKFQKNN